MMLSKIFVIFMTVSFMAAAFLLAAYASHLYSLNFSTLVTWTYEIQSMELELTLYLDKTSCLFLSVVSIISSAVLLFSFNYMKEEKFYLRFHLILISFIFSMYLLILCPNLISILLGWDGLGVTSFLLVIYYQSSKSFNAGMLTVMTNRLGDLLILAVLTWTSFGGSWSFLFTKDILSPNMPLMFVLLSVAAFTKSAQIPFSAWLPAAMAAPTPVSSLVHSSTLVTAGVYLLIRLFDIINFYNLLPMLLTIGVLTMFMAGCSAMMETDMKKIVALSTLSQLGLMICSLGMGVKDMTFIHLISHAFFKAMLFMAVGNMIHLANDFQDLRKASLPVNLTITLTFCWGANMSLCGLPFLSGFYSKDLILEYALPNLTNSFLEIIIIISTMLTASYSVRSMVLCWWAGKRSISHSWENDEEKTHFNCCFILFPLAVGGGAYLMLLNEMFLLHLNLSIVEKNCTLAIVTLGGMTGFLTTKYNFFSTKYLINWSWGMMWTLPLWSASLHGSYFLKMAFNTRSSDLTWVFSAPMFGLLGSQESLSNETIWPKIYKFFGMSMFILFLFIVFL